MRVTRWVAAVLAFVTATVGALAVASPASARPTWKNAYASYYRTDGRLLGSAHIERLSATHFDIAVADHYSDGLAVCVVIIMPGPDGYSNSYCDDNNVAAAKHYPIYYDWSYPAFLVGSASSQFTYSDL